MQVKKKQGTLISIEKKEKAKKALKKFIDFFELGFFKEEVERRTNHYLDYIYKITRLEVIHANVHYITSSESREIKEVERITDWEKFIDKKEFKIYSGFGPHNEMLTPAYVEENARLIKRILEKVYVDKYN